MKKMSTPLTIALIAAGAQILAAVIKALSQWHGGG